MKKTLLIILILALTLVMCACTKETQEDPLEIVNQLIDSGNEDVMLFDYFRQVVGTEEEQGYFEIVLYAKVDEEGRISKENVRMDVYTDGGLRSEKLKTYSDVPYVVFENAMSIAKEYEMALWSEMEDLISIDGCNYVCKFPNGEQYVRVSSDEMPENGMEAFEAVLAALEIDE